MMKPYLQQNNVQERAEKQSFYQPMLFQQSTPVKITLSESHEFFKLSHLINWTALIALVETIRETKVQKATGPKPRYRALPRALVLMAMRKMTYREAEDQIAHYLVPYRAHRISAPLGAYTNQ